MIASIAAGIVTILIALPATYGMVRLKIGRAWLPDFTLVELRGAADRRGAAAVLSPEDRRAC